MLNCVDITAEVALRLWTFCTAWMYLRSPLFKGNDDRTNSGSNRRRLRGDAPRNPVVAEN